MNPTTDSQTSEPEPTPEAQRVRDVFDMHEFRVGGSRMVSAFDAAVSRKQVIAAAQEA